MKIKTLFFIFLILLNLNTLVSKEILDILTPIISSLMKEKNIPEIQLLIFRPEQVKSLQYKRDLKDQSTVRIINSEKYYDRFFISEISYPIINFIIYKNRESIYSKFQDILKENILIKNIYDSFLKSSDKKINYYLIPSKFRYELIEKEAQIIDCLLNMICGIEISKSGIHPKDSVKDEKFNIRLIDLPYQNFYLSTYNYLLLKQILDYTFGDAIDFLNKNFRTFDLQHTFLHVGEVNDKLLNEHKILRGSFSDKKISFIPDLIISNPLSFGMVSNVIDYYKILKILMSSNYVFNGFYTKDHRTGGYYQGFFYRKSCNDQYYIAEAFGIFPGTRTYVFLMENGYGFILFQSSDNEYVLHFLREQIENFYYKILNINCSLKNPEVWEPLYGYFRPVNVVETTVSLFSDIWIRKNDRNQIEVSNFFNKDPVGYIYQINQYNYFIGLNRINRYPVIFQNENRIIIGIYEYKKIYWFQSIRGLIIIFYGIVVVMTIFLLKFILNKFPKKIF